MHCQSKNERFVFETFEKGLKVLLMYVSMLETTEDYLKKLRINTSTNMIKKWAKQVKDNERIEMNLKISMDNLEQHILLISKEKMMTASNYGHFFTNILEFTIFDMYDDNHTTIYLLKGPRLNIAKHKQVFGDVFFKSKGIVPIIERINSQMYPIKFSVRYNKTSRKHVLCSNWYDLKDLTT